MRLKETEPARDKFKSKSMPPPVAVVEAVGDEVVAAAVVAVGDEVVVVRFPVQAMILNYQKLRHPQRRRYDSGSPLVGRRRLVS